MKQQLLSGLILFAAAILLVSSQDTSGTSRKCPAVKCNNRCPNGFVNNEDGCPTCECNFCRFGQPLYQLSCEEGHTACRAMNGLCTESKPDKEYCCPQERPGCCPPGPDPASVSCPMATCKDDFGCPLGQKCCGPCLSCVDAIYT